MADESGRASELVKRLLTVGVGALFLTEESLRGLISEFKLPKEMLGAVLDSANKSKNDFLKTLAREMMVQIVDRVDPKDLASHLLQNHEFDLQVKINIIPKKKKGKSASAEPSSEKGKGFQKQSKAT